MPARGHYDTHSAYRNQAYLVGKGIKFGRDRTQVPNWEVEVSRGVPWFGGTTLASDDRGVNGAGVLFDIITDDVFGLGVPESRLNEATWQATHDAIDDFRISPLITNVSDVRSVIAQLLEYFDLWIRRNGAQIEIGQWQHGDIDTSALPQVGSDDLTAEPDLTWAGWGDTINRVNVVYSDREHYFHDAVESYDDANNFRIVGEQRETTLQRPWITDAALAKRYATEFCKMHAQPLTSGTIKVKRERVDALQLLPGALVMLNAASYGWTIALRVLEIEWPGDSDGYATLTVENERAIWPQLYVQPPAPKPGNFRVDPVAIANARVLELPSGLKTSQAIQVAVIAQRPSTETRGFRVYVSVDDAVYDLAASSVPFAAFGKVVTANYPNSTADLDTAVGLEVELFGADSIVTQTDTERDDNHLLVIYENGEIASAGQVTALGAGKFNVQQRRARYGTTKSAHNIGTKVWFIERSALVPIANRNFASGVTRHFKLQPFTNDGELELTSVVSFAYVFGATGAVPAPFNLTISGYTRTNAEGQIIVHMVPSWDWVRDADIVSFEVGLNQPPDTDWKYYTVAAPIGATVASQDIWPAGQLNGYVVRVRAMNSKGEWSDYVAYGAGVWSSPTAHATVSPPTSLTARASQLSVALDWINSTDAGIDTIEILASTTNDVTTAAVIGSVAYPGTSFVHGGLVGGTHYYYWVRSRDTLGRPSATSPSGGGVSAIVGDVTATSVADFSVTATKMFQRVVILQGDVWTDNSPAAGSIAWNAHQLVYNGVAYNISAGNTANQFVYWKPSVSTTVYQTSNTPPTLGDGDFMIATNADLDRDGNGDGLHDLAWNAIANAVIGTAHIMKAAITDALIANLSAGKITTGTLDAARIAAGSIVISKLGSDVTPANLGADVAGAAAAAQSAAAADATSKANTAQSNAYSHADAAANTAQANAQTNAATDAQTRANIAEGNAKAASLDKATFLDAATQTVIEGGKIKTGTIDANRIAAGTTFTNQLFLGALLEIATGGLIRSANFVAGSAGWRIQSNGAAEFKAVVIRDGVVVNSLAAPVFEQSPSGSSYSSLTSKSYSTNFFFRVRSASGTVLYWTTDGTEPSPANPNALNSASNPSYFVNDYTTIGFGSSSVTVTMRARAYTGVSGSGSSATWSSRSDETTVSINYAPDAVNMTPTAQPYLASQSGTWGSGTVTGTPTCPTSGATIWYSTDGTNYSQYTGGTLSVGVGGELHLYATKAGFQASNSTDYYNQSGIGGGGRLPQ